MNTSTFGANSDEHHFATNTDEAGNKSTESTEVNTSKQLEQIQEGTNPS